MALIRATTELPSGISGWYIYHDVSGKIYISSPDPINQWCYHTKEDVIFIRDILNRCISRMGGDEE